MTPTSTPAQAASTPMPPALPTIPGVKITSSKQILSKDSRLAWLLWGPSGYGKTALAGQLHELTMKTLGKPTLFIACESAEGGGAATIRNMDVPIYVPKSYEELDKTLRYLRNDKSYGGVVLDSASEFNKSYIKAATLKYPSRENSPTRSAGVLTRSDYMVSAELTSQLFRSLIALTTLDDPACRKHMIVTASDQTKEEDERVVWIGPDLSGRMSREAVQMMQQVLALEIKPELKDGKRQVGRFLVSSADGVKALKDRYDILPNQIKLRKFGTNEDGETLLSIWEKFYIPNMA